MQFETSFAYFEFISASSFSHSWNVSSSLFNKRNCPKRLYAWNIKIITETGIRGMERPESSEFDRTVALVITQKSPGKITGLVLKPENHEPGDYLNAKIWEIGPISNSEPRQIWIQSGI